MNTKILVTGGCGFVGSHFVEHFLKNTDWEIFIIDKLNYASGGFDRLKDIPINEKVRVFASDFAYPISSGIERELRDTSYIFHLGAETHVDRSIENPEHFVMSNVVGTMRLLDFARNLKNLKRFFYFSTDEVYGPAPYGVSYKETDRHSPQNPYAATKSGAEALCTAYHNTYKVPVIIMNCMNIFGERQHPEKFIPMTIKKLLNKEKIIIHSDPTRTKSGSRFYIHARNVAAASLFLAQNGALGEVYHLVGDKEVSNLEIAERIAKIMNAPLDYELVDFHSKRPGHDLRYGLDGSKMKTLGWSLPVDFERSFEKTIRWTLENPRWLYFEKLQTHEEI